MAITTLDGWIASVKEQLAICKTATRTTVAGGWFSMFDVAGQPSGTLAIGNTANGTVPTDATAGYPPISAAAATKYLSSIRGSNTVAGRLKVCDRLFAAGAYAFNANTALASIPSYSGRVPGGTDFRGLELWVEQVTAATGNQAVNVTYTDQDGNTGATTGAVGIGAAPTVGRCWQLPLAAGDNGVQQVTNVAGSVATAGTFNVMVLRPLVDIFIVVANSGQLLDFLKTGLKQIFADSALYFLVNNPSGTSSGLPNIYPEVADG